MQAPEHVLRYLSHTHTEGIFFGKSDEKFNTLWGWVDADFATDLHTRRSHTDYILILNGMGDPCPDLYRIMEQLGFTQREPTELYEGSRLVIVMTENPVNHKTSRHNRDYIGELVGLGQVTLTPSQTDKMVPDVLTKGLSVLVFERHKAEMLGLELDV